MYYRGIMNRIALQQLATVPDIPDYHLMIGSAEQLASVPVLIYQTVVPPEAKALIPPASREEMDTPLNGTTYTTDDFINNTFYLGNPIDGGL